MTVTGMGAGVARMLAAACLWAGLAAAVAVPGPAFAGQFTDECVDPGSAYQPVPWAQQLLAPERAWPFSQGEGVTVALLSSGVDADHPQLRGRVAEGFDAATGTGTADDDCFGTGTQVAGVIAAGQTAGVGLVGLAPEATILPVRVTGDRPTDPVDPAVLTRGIQWAAANGADIINVAVAVYSDDADLRAAVAGAQDAGITIVAAVGVLGEAAADEAEGRQESAADEAEGGQENEDGAASIPYPAGYPGVIGVGAIDPSGGSWPGSRAGDFVDLVAPGAAMVTLQPGGGMAVDVAGTGIASGIVAGAAALVQARWGDEIPAGLAPELVARRLVATATPAPAGPAFGHGVVNPYAAVNDLLPVDVSPVPLPGLEPPAGGPESAWVRARGVAVAGTAAAALLVVAVIVVAQAVPRGRRRWWRTAVVAPPPEPEASEPGPPVMLFDRPRP